MREKMRKTLEQEPKDNQEKDIGMIENLRKELGQEKRKESGQKKRNGLDFTN